MYKTVAGLPYYHNHVTNVTQWECPPELQAARMSVEPRSPAHAFMIPCKGLRWVRWVASKSGGGGQLEGLNPGGSTGWVLGTELSEPPPETTNFCPTSSSSCVSSTLLPCFRRPSLPQFCANHGQQPRHPRFHAHLGDGPRRLFGRKSSELLEAPRRNLA